MTGNGDETTLGYFDMSLFQPSDETHFEWAVLGELRDASRRVLANALVQAAALQPEQREQ